MVHYESIQKKGEKTKIKKIMWMDPDILRLCVDVQRPTIRERARGRIPFGVYMRDIAEVRKGNSAYGFLKSSEPPSDSDTCLSLVGSERTICIQLPSKFSRDWFSERFNLVILDVLTEEEQAVRAKRKRGIPVPAYFLEKSIADQMQALLERGIQVIHHHPNGKMIKAFVMYDAGTERISIHPSETYFLGYAPISLGLDAKDVSEVRPGSHSLGFVRTNSTDKLTECLSIVGSEAVIDLQLATQKARDLFVSKLRVFIYQKRPPEVEEEYEDSEADEQTEKSEH
mmetsp:Transcript_29705/g.30112  ORF Transcript_29705/g.30112 Transcript_29705/m.30112 type:complete len:284 (+) Transcript_29705:441-1292(+)